MRFCDIPYHYEIKKRLAEMADSGRVPHALMLEGPSGAGKFALARAFVQYLHCTDRRDGDSCGKCISCRQHQSHNHIDTYFCFPVVKKSPRPEISSEYAYEFYEFIDNNPYMDFEGWLKELDNINAQPAIYVNEGSELSHWMSLTAAQSQYKTVILWLPERMREETANKLLKMVEEPSDHAMFVMTSDNSQEVLPTIYSRVQRVKVPPYTSAEICGILQKDYGVDKEKAEIIASVSGGDINRAISQIKITKQRQKFFEFFKELMRKSYSRSVGDLKNWSTEVSTLGREPLMLFMDYCGGLMRENFMLNLNTPSLSQLMAEEREFCSRFHPFINERNVLQFVESFDKAKNDIAGNANAKIVTFDLAIRCILLLIK